MWILPEWAPNLHPLVVHFPIALLFAAVLFDAVGMAARNVGFWRKGATALFTLGALAVLAAFFSGQQAADSVFLPTAANALLTEHAELGEWTMWFYSVYAVIRLALSFGRVAQIGIIRGLLFLVGAGGLALVTITADHGAEMVFKHGVGVEAVESLPASDAVISDSTAARAGGLVVERDSVWTLTSARAAAWKSGFSWLSGTPAEVQSRLVDGGEWGDVLELTISEDSPVFIVPTPLAAIQVDLVANLDGLEGSLAIVHHVVDGENFRFLSIGNGALRMGNSEQGDLLITSSVDAPTAGWNSYRLVVDGTHVRVYRNTELVGHGHPMESEPGPVGLRLNGKGSVQIASMRVTSIR
jgi:uncharacterized membrane protein